MFQIVVIPMNTDANFSLSFKTKERAIEVYERITDPDLPMIKESDDFGYKVIIRTIFISYIMFVDIEKSQEVIFEKNVAIEKAHTRIIQNEQSKTSNPRIIQ